MRVLVLCLALVLLLPGRARAEWHLKPFIAAAFAGKTTFIDFENAAGSRHWVYGGSGVWIGEVVGVEGDVAVAPRFFQSGDTRPDNTVNVVNSRVTTVTGNVVVALPRSLSEYTLRPYFVGGAGLMRVRIDDFGGLFPVASTLPAMDLGGGVVGFLTERIGLGWDVRHFRSFGTRDQNQGLSAEPEQLSFWRANMSLVVRY